MSVEVLLATLIVRQTKGFIFQKMIDVMSALGVDVESWESGDPTRSALYAKAIIEESREDLVCSAIEGGFLDTAAGDWLTVKTASDYEVERRAATYATTTVRYTNAGSELFTIDPYDDVLINTSTEERFVNVTGGTLSPGGGTLTVTVIAETAGSGATSAAGEIDAFASGSERANVTVTSLAAAVGTDDEKDTELRARAKAKLGALSPNGPNDAYHYVLTTPELNGGAQITKTRVDGDSTNGTVTIYVAGASGAVSGGDVTLGQAAVEEYSEPICIGATVINSTNVVQAVTYELWVYSTINLTTDAIEERIEDALAEALSSRDIGGDVIPPALTGALYVNFLEATILNAVAPFGFRVSVTTPASDVGLTPSQVLVAGTVTPNVHQVKPRGVV